MSRVYKRQRQFYLFTAVVVAIAVINLLFFLILYQPARSEYFRLQDSIRRLHAETASRSIRVRQKEQIAAQLETSNQDRTALVTEHFIPLERGFAQLLPELDRIARESGLQKSHGDYGRDTTPQFGLYSVKIRIPIQGAYPNIVKFINELENSETFYIITSVDVRSSGDNTLQPAAGMVALSLALETYFYQ